MKEKFGIDVHFSDIHYNYYSAWRYVTKEDTSYEESEGHPDLCSNYQAPRTSNTSNTEKERVKGVKRKDKSSKQTKRKG